tara:strand:- start:66252 stop:66701 length:450 start_codon:yes stop_codon:yes gene_type:complete
MSDDAELNMVVPGLLVWPSGATQPQLCGSVCPACELYAYPRTEVCSECFGQMERTSFSGAGTIYSHTTVRVKPPLGLPRPYSVAYIDLAGVPLRIFGLLDPKPDYSYSIGEEVSLQVREMGFDAAGNRCLRPLFVPGPEAILPQTDGRG